MPKALVIPKLDGLNESGRMLTVRQLAEKLQRTPAYVRVKLVPKLRTTQLCDGGAYLIDPDSVCELLGIEKRQRRKPAKRCRDRGLAALERLKTSRRRPSGGRVPGRKC